MAAAAARPLCEGSPVLVGRGLRLAWGTGKSGLVFVVHKPTPQRASVHGCMRRVAGGSMPANLRPF
eukprot:365027-Chlamydomonas_euryale.AAC.7